MTRGKYRAIGPNPAAKPKDMKSTATGWWDPPVVEVIGEREDAWLLKGGSVILKGCERFWVAV